MEEDNCTYPDPPEIVLIRTGMSVVEPEDGETEPTEGNVFSHSILLMSHHQLLNLYPILINNLQSE